MAETAAISAQEHASTFTDKMRTTALIIVALAFVMDLLDSTIVNIAIPSIRMNLSASYSSIQWVIAGYSLAFAVLLVTGGRMGDVFGYKKLFIVGIGGFTIASLISGLSTSPDMLIVARILQGSMAALMVPQVMSLMQVMYAPRERGAINGLFGALGGLAATMGPIVGGLIIRANWFNLDWRPIFLINLPIGIFALVAGLKYLPDGKSSHPLKLDVIGTVIIMAATMLLVFPLIQGRELGWPSWTFAMMAAAVPLFAVFAYWQRRKMAIDGSPLILPSLFKNRSFGVGLGVNLVFEMAMIGYFLTFGLVLQIGLGFTPIHAALTGIPTAIGIALTMAILGKSVMPKLGRYALSIGATCMGIGLAITTLVLSRYSLSVHSWQLIPGLLIIGIGMGLMFGTLYTAVLNGVDPQHAGSASGTLNAIQQVGGAIGVAVIGVVFFGQLNHSAPASFSSQEPALHAQLTALNVPLQAQDAIVSGVGTCYVDRTREQDSSITPASCQQATSISGDPELASVVQESALQANATNFNKAFKWSVWYSLGLLVLTFALSFLLPARFKTEAYSEE